MFNKDYVWYKLREIAQDKEDTNESITWKEIYQLMISLERRHSIQETSNFALSEEAMQLAINLQEFGDENGYSCYDYIEYLSFKEDKNKYLVGIYTEPLGIVPFEGEEINSLLTNISILYKSQPRDMSYINAGHKLHKLYEDTDAPLNFEDNIVDIKGFWESASV